MGEQQSIDQNNRTRATHHAPLTWSELLQLDVGLLHGVSSTKIGALRELELNSMANLLTNYPRKYVDRSQERSISALISGDSALVLGTITSVQSRRSRNGKQFITAVLEDESGSMRLTYFNQRWRERQLKDLINGPTVAVFGKVDRFRGATTMTNPVVDPIGTRTGRIIPMYSTTEKVPLSTWDYADITAQVLRRCTPRGLLDPIPQHVRQHHGLIDRLAAFTGIHHPTDWGHQRASRHRLAFEELLRIQLVLVKNKRRAKIESTGIQHVIDGDLIERFRNALPYPLTSAQERVLHQISRDLADRAPMNRLLQGDVGAGKTVVAVSALLMAVQGGHQGALLAPTEVLAEQHGDSVRALVDGLMVSDPNTLTGERQLRVVVLSNRVQAAQRREILEGLKSGSIDIAVGTHALLQETVQFHDLGVVVVDEQHRFGVQQRAALGSRGATHSPDVLVMTATPIPRTAAMTVYGDLDVSVLDELPPGRTPIETKWATTSAQEAKAWHLVRDQVKRGQRVYVVCPLVEDSEAMQAASAESKREELLAGELQGYEVGLLHGRMNAVEKEQQMNAFRSGTTPILVATTVIEVGVDVPEATVMVIIDAHRFGIAQLHQLRGRVGRGAAKSYCILLSPEDISEEGKTRLQALVDSTDGFALAEIDLELRGAGTVMGDRQKGRSDLKLASLVSDVGLVSTARQVAEELVDGDGTLEQYPDLAAEIHLFEEQERVDYLEKS